MIFRDTFITTVVAGIFTPVLLCCISITSAQGMQSTSYKIESDSINFGGGLSSSTNYTLESSAGEVATGESGSANFNLKAGYQQMVSSVLSMSIPSAVTMAPSIPGITGGTSNGSTTVTVTTDNFAGYELSIASTQSPALVSGAHSIADYTPVGNPDFSFITTETDSHFGYSPSGADVVTRFKDNGVSCNTGALETNLACWDGLSTVEESVARRTSANTPNGSTTTINFRVEVGGSVSQSEGTYTATTTLTALTL